MDKIFTGALLISFLGLALFSFSAMAGMDGQHTNCLAVTARGGALPCPDNGWAVLSLHLGTLQFFSLAILIGLVSLFVLATASSEIAFSPLAVASWFSRFPVIQKHRAAIRHWFTLHENSPNAWR